MAGLSPSASICPGSPDHSWRTGSSRWTAPSWWRRSASTRRGWTECWGKSGCPPAPCWTAGILRPSETARGHQQSSALTHTHTHRSSSSARWQFSGVAIFFYHAFALQCAHNSQIFASANARGPNGHPLHAIGALKEPFLNIYVLKHKRAIKLSPLACA